MYQVISKKTVLLVFLLTTFHFCHSQIRFNAQTGFGAISETGFEFRLNSTFGISWRFENGFSWGIQYGFMQPNKVTSNGVFLYCDSLTGSGWHSGCAPGHDTVIESLYSLTYRKSFASVNFLWHKKLKHHCEIANGFNVSGEFFNRQKDIYDPFLPDLPLEKGIATSICFLNRFSFFPFEKKPDIEFYIESKLGVFISPQPVCDDSSCDNFLEKPLNLNGLFQIGFAF